MRRQQQYQLTGFETAKAGLVKTKSLMFFTSTMLQTPFVEDPTCPTAWTDMVRIGYNPTFIESLEIPVIKFVIIHEVMHIKLKHGLRRGDRDPIRWNVACDYAVNWILKKAGFVIWQWALIDDKYAGMSAEQIYALREQEMGAGRKGPGGQGQGPGQPEKTQGGLGGDLRPVPAVTPEQIARIDHEISKTLARAAAIARQYGVMPAGLEAVIGVTYEDPVSWEQTLLDYMTRTISHDESWNRRNRRYHEVILPSRASPGMDELTIIADSSGSMFSKAIFERVAVAVNHIVSTVKPLTTRVVWADDKDCQNIDVFEPGDEVVLHPKGGGGTDLRKPLTFVEQYNPEVVLLLTDCFTPWPDVPTPFPLIIGATTDVPCPDWAAVVRIEVQ